jgi:nucleobase:cation symporter-1, NCS1 family
MLESHSIDYVPWKERHGKVWHQGPFWFTSNFVLFTLAVGFIGPPAGLGLGWTALAAAVGSVIGTFFMAFHANQGPRLGVPQMIQSRAQFGTRGAIFGLLAALFVYIGLNVFDIPMATQGLQAVVGPGSRWPWYAAIVLVQATIAVVGYDMIHLVQRWLTYVLILVFAVLTVGSVVVLGGTSVLRMGPFTAVAFFSQLAGVAGYLIGYSIYVSDYTRYLPADTKLKPVVLWTYAGAVLSTVWLVPLGALFAITLKNGATVISVFTVGNMITPGFGTAVMLISSIALVTVMSVNTYGAILVALTAIDGFRPIRSSVRVRVFGAIAMSALTLAIALFIPERYEGGFNGFLSLMLYLLIPWSAVNLVDYYWVRRGKYSVVDLFSRASLYGRWAWRGLLAYAAGLLAMAPFFVLPFYTGLGARALEGVDISILFGLPVAGLVYYYLARDLDLGPEEIAYETSLAALEPSTVKSPSLLTEQSKCQVISLSSDDGESLLKSGLGSHT